MNCFNAIEALTELCAMPESTAIDAQAFGIERLRAARELIATWLPRVEDMLRVEDERELAEARARVAEIEARMGTSRPGAAIPVDRPPEKFFRPASDFDLTDAGAGIGALDEGTVDGQGAEDFRAELKALQGRSKARRRQRGL